MKIKSPVIPAILLLCLLVVLPIQGQTPSLRTFEALQLTTEYTAAVSLVEQGYQDEAAAAFLKLADQHPNTTLGATCLFQAAAYSSNETQSLALYQRILRDYPNSRFEADARLGLLNYGPQLSGAAWLAAVDTILPGYGAPSSMEILQDPVLATAKFRSLPTENQRALPHYYEHMEIVIDGQGRTEDLIKLDMFGREAFAGSDPDSTYFLNGLNNAIVKLNGGEYGLSRNPQLRLLTDRDRLRGRRPTIRFEALLRGYSDPMNLETSTFTLDGQDVKSQVATLRHTLNAKPRQNGVFEKLRLAYRPAAPLQSGRHTFVAVLNCVNGEGKGTLIVNFTVDPRDRDCDDPDRDDDWDRD